MENIGVICDVCTCAHNENGCKCCLEQIEITEHCTCGEQKVENPHYCRSYRQR